MASKRDYYEVLSVERTSTHVEIRKAYKKLALENHPDRNPGDDTATDRFKEAAEAYEVLSDENKRRRYDQYGHAGVNGAGGRGQFHDASDIFDAFGDIFGDFFGQSRGRGGSGGARRGAHLQTVLTIDLVEAATGCKKTIHVNRHQQCERCEGNGSEPGTTPEPCDYCNGAGQVVQSQGFFRVQTTCPACRGAGHVIRHKCNVCYGSGQQEESVDLEVPVPAGIDHGMQLCLRGEGEPGARGGPRGDLYVEIRIEEHPLFHREGSELLCHVPVTYTQAALGATVDVPTIGGRHEFKVPPGTQPGQRFRLRNQGMPDPHGSGRKGDLHVIIELEVPKKIDEEQEALLRQLAEFEKAEVNPKQKSFFEQLKEYFTGDEDE